MLANKSKIINHYRPEIDGLRAVAVSLVLLYHANIRFGAKQLFPAGYIGVDVFFVISGYLITSIVYREISRGSFSFLAFYERRARRILPALFVVLMASSVAAWLWLLPRSFVDYGYSMLSTVLFGSNIYFWKYTGLYAAEVGEFLPLLHMWSLSVEEQFYLLYPPVILLLFKLCKKHFLLILGIFFIASILLAEWASFYAYSANFYLMPTRAWELLAGGILVWCTPVGNIGSRVKRWIPTAGVASILLFAMSCDGATRHPSLLTLIPVLGCMAIIVFASKEDVTTRLLSSSGFVYVGLLSYSLYLWHQPVFVFSRLLLNRELSLFEIGVALAGTFCLSLASYHFVERPTRRRDLTSIKGIWTIVIVGTVCSLFFAVSTITGKGFPERFPHAVHILKMMKRGEGPAEWTFRAGIEPVKLPGNPQGRYTLLTVGDSHLEALNVPISDKFKSDALFSSFIPLSSGSFPFVFGLDLADQAKPNAPLRGLLNANQARYEVIRGAENPIALIGGRLPYYIKGEPFDNKEGGAAFGNGLRFVTFTEGGYTFADLDVIKARYAKTIGMLIENGVKVVLIYPIPEVGWNVPRELGIGTGLQLDKLPGNRKTPLSTSYEVFKNRTAEAYAIYDSIPDDWNLIRVYPESLFCDGVRCYTHDQTYPYYFDYQHLSYVGAEMLVDRILQRITEKWGAAPQNENGAQAEP